MFRVVASAALVSSLFIGSAWAQTNSTLNSSNNSSPNPPAVTTTAAPVKTSAAPVAGANSFTQTEATKRIESFGYSNVMNLKKDDQSIWRAQATKDGHSVSVALDYQGNVVAQ